MRGKKIKPVSEKSVGLHDASVESLTESQLNTDIMDMLNVNQTWNRCELICRGNPITDTGKRLHMLKMLTVVLVPVVVLTGMTANTFIVSLDNYISLSNIRKILYFSIELGWLLRMMQRERDISALYISSKSSQTKDFLLDRYPDTDVGLQNLSFWPTSATIVRREFQTKESFLSYLNRHRYQLESYNRTSKDEVAFYSDSIEVFIKWLYQAIVEARSGTVWPKLVAYQEIVVASEYFGRERGLGVSFYAIGSFTTRDEYLDFVESQDIANITFESARRYSEMAYSIYEDTLVRNSSVIQPISDMRREIRSNKSSAGKGSLKYANWWFENMTVYQDTLREVQIQLVLEIDEILRKEAEEDLRNIVVISVVLGIILILCPLIVFAVYSLISVIQKYSISIANRTKALNKEKKRTDMLLYQMLPRSVAERLKKNENVGAETYTESTVFFSDIVGFTQIASQCSPIQVVDMLNSLYSLFDQRIEVYDVYKVETIGDAYMVVSGLPKMNGRRHASEIANMALDIIEHFSRLEIPHLPGTKFKLRIGCHSGPVVAAVVGAKMPRYCLFGETVCLASKMESLGKCKSIVLTTILTKIKEGLQIYCDTAYSRSGVNQMWILKNSKELLDSFRSRSLSSISCIKTFDFFTLYTTIPHSQLKARLKDLIYHSFLYKNGKRRYKYLVINGNSVYFVQDHSDAKHKYTEDDIVKMLTFLIDNIFVEFAGQIFQQVIGIPMGTNCAPLLADLFLYSYEAEFIQGLLAKGEKKLAQTFNFSFRYIDDLLSLNNPRFHDFTHLIYPKELELKDTTDTPCSASYLDLFLKYDPNGKLDTRIYDKHDDFNFSIVNSPFLCSNIPASPAYGVYISQLIRYGRACSNYEDFIARGHLLTTRLQYQGYTTPRLKSTFRKFFGRQHDIVGLYEKSAFAGKIHISEATSDLLNDIGGYTVEQRKDFNVQKDVEVQNVYRGLVRTYWLLNHEGEDDIGSMESVLSNVPSND